MADLSITAGNVLISSTSPKAAKEVTYGATVTNGMALGLNTSDNEWYPLDANDDLTGYSEDQIGIALVANGDGQTGLIAPNGATLNVGATTTAGVEYDITSTDVGTANGTAGGIVAASSLGSGDTPVHLFIGNGTASVTLRIDVADAALA